MRPGFLISIIGGIVLLKKIENLEVVLIAISFVTMTVITFGNVVSRYLFIKSWSFTEEITTNLFLWIVFLGASIATKRKGHLGLSIVTDHLSPKLRNIVTGFTTLCSAILFAFLFKYGTNMVINQFLNNSKSPGLNWPEWIYGLSVPVGALILVFRFIELGYKEIRGFNNK